MANYKWEHKMTDDIGPDRADLSTIVMPKDKVIEINTTNRDGHQAVFDEAMQGYETRSIELLQEHIERIKKGKRERILVSLPVPENHTEDYDRIISFLEHDIRDEVELSARDFDQYIRDNWSWKGEFVATTAMYNNR